QELVQEATGRNVATVAGTAAIDPLADPQVGNLFATAWTNPQNQALQANSNGFERAASAMVYNVLKGNAGQAHINRGGYDYHGNGRAAQDAKDFESGVTVGSILESASILQRPVF